MSSLVASVGSNGTSVALTTGSLPSWVLSAAAGDTNNPSGAQLNSPNTTTFATNYVNSITDSTHFTLKNTTTAGTGIDLYAAQIWTAAQNNLWWQNSNQKPPTSTDTSIGAGYFGSDGDASIDLSPTGVAGLYGMFLTQDCYWATAASQTRSTATGGTGSNTLCLQVSSADTSAASCTFYNGGVAGQGFFPHQDAGSTPMYPFAGIAISSTCVLVALQPATITDLQLPSVQIFWGNPSGSGGLANPANWQRISSWFPDGWPVPFGGWRLNLTNWGTKANDGYAYVGCGIGASSLNPTLGTPDAGGLALCRFALTDLQAATPLLLKPQWWTGSAWKGFSDFTPQNLLYQIASIGPEGPNVSGANPYRWGRWSGDMYQKSDLSWVYVTGCPTSGSGAPVYVAPVATLTTTMTSTTFAPIYYPAAQGALGLPGPYEPKAHPWVTWTGKNTDDICISFSTIDAALTYTNTATYWNYMLQVAGI